MYLTQVLSLRQIGLKSTYNGLYALNEDKSLL